MPLNPETENYRRVVQRFGSRPTGQTATAAFR
jgi:hypothetical protein